MGRKKGTGSVRVEPQRYSSELVHELLQPILMKLTAQGIRWEIAGELRRGLPKVRSAIVLCDTSRSELLEMFPLATPAPNHHWICRIPLDEMPVYLCTALPEEWGSKLLFTTATWIFRKGICAKAREQGFKLNWRGLWRNGSRYAGRTEEQIFACLEMDPIPPQAMTVFYERLRKPKGELTEEEKETRNAKRKRKRKIAGLYHSPRHFVRSKSRKPAGTDVGD